MPCGFVDTAGGSPKLNGGGVHTFDHGAIRYQSLHLATRQNKAGSVAP
jgi:hypothetical protein